LPGKIVARNWVGKIRPVVYDRGRIAKFDVKCTGPSWSPDGKSFGCVNNGQLVMISYPGEKILERIEFPREISAVRFMIGSSKVVYSNSLDSEVMNNLYIYDLETKEDRQVTFFEDFRANTAAFYVSPDGKKVMFERTGRYAADSDGKQVRLPELVYLQDLETGELSELFEGGDLAVSRDWTQLVYTAKKMGDQEFESLKFIVRDMRTGEERALPHPASFRFDPTFSPDGEWIAYTESGAGFDKHLVAVRTDGSGEKHILIGAGHSIGSPDWGS